MLFQVIEDLDYDYRMAAKANLERKDKMVEKQINNQNVWAQNRKSFLHNRKKIKKCEN